MILVGVNISYLTPLHLTLFSTGGGGGGIHLFAPYRLNPNLHNVFSKLFNAGGAQSSSTLKSAVSSIFLHTKQQKTFQGTLGTQDLTSIGSRTSLGPLMNPKGSLK